MSVPTQRDKRLDAVLVKNASTRKPVHTSDKFGFFFGCAYPNPKNLKNDEDVKPEELDTLLKDMIGGPMFIEHEGYDQEYIVNKGADAVKDVRKSSNSIGTIHDAWVCPKTGKIETIFSLNSSSLANKAREQMKKGGLGELSIGYLITHSHGKRKLHFTELSVCDTGRQDNTNIYYSCSAKSNTIGPKPSLSLNSLQGDTPKMSQEGSSSAAPAVSGGEQVEATIPVESIPSQESDLRESVSQRESMGAEEAAKLLERSQMIYTESERIKRESEEMKRQFEESQKAYAAAQARLKELEAREEARKAITEDDHISLSQEVLSKEEQEKWLSLYNNPATKDIAKNHIVVNSRRKITELKGVTSALMNKSGSSLESQKKLVSDIQMFLDKTPSLLGDSSSKKRANKDISEETNALHLNSDKQKASTSQKAQKTETQAPSQEKSWDLDSMLFGSVPQGIRKDLNRSLRG